MFAFKKFTEAKWLRTESKRNANILRDVRGRMVYEEK